MAFKDHLGKSFKAFSEAISEDIGQNPAPVSSSECVYVAGCLLGRKISQDFPIAV